MSIMIMTIYITFLPLENILTLFNSTYRKANNFVGVEIKGFSVKTK